MKHIIITTIAAVLVVGCGEAQQPVPSPEAKPVEPVADAAKPEGQPEPTTAKAPDISIWDAAADGNTEAVKQHLAAGVDVNAKDKYGTTPLHRAAEKGHKEVVALLIAKGADVNAMTNTGWTSLHFAALKGRKEIAELLLASGADVNAKDKTRGGTPLHYAAISPNYGRGHKEIAELLITKGADVNAKAADGGPSLD